MSESNTSFDINTQDAQDAIYAVTLEIENKLVEYKDLPKAESTKKIEEWFMTEKYPKPSNVTDEQHNKNCSLILGMILMACELSSKK